MTESFQKIKRFRSKKYTADVATNPCLACNREDGTVIPHHVRYAEVSGIGVKVSDKWVVPLCFSCHRGVHLHGSKSEILWWQHHNVDPLAWARENYSKWEKEHGQV